MKLNVQAAGLALGIVWGVFVFLLALAGLFFGYGTEIVEILSTLYRGYNSTFGGGIIGLIWGFFDAYVVGVIGAWLYNRLADRTS